MAIDKKSIKKIFPHLYEELETGEVKVPINAVRKNPLEAEEAAIGEEYETARKKRQPALRRLINYDILTLLP